MFVIPHVRTVRPLASTLRRVQLAPSIAQVIDRCFEESGMPASADLIRTPALDVHETDREYLLELDLPGVAREALEISIEGRKVRVQTLDQPAQPQTTGTPVANEPAAQADKVEAARSLYRERSAARYARTVSLPKEVDSEVSEARLVNGVLSLRLVKRNADGVRRLTIS